MKFLVLVGVWSLNFLIVGAMLYGVWAWGKSVGIAEGSSMALSTNPVSEDLEMICAGLWVGEQNKKYREK